MSSKQQFIVVDRDVSMCNFLHTFRGSRACAALTNADAAGMATRVPTKKEQAL